MWCKYRTFDEVVDKVAQIAYNMIVQSDNDFAVDINTKFVGGSDKW